MNNIQIQYENEPYVVFSCKDCPKKNTNACNSCSRKRTEAKPKSECHSCAQTTKQSKCNCENTSKNTCSTTRSVCNSNHFVVQNYFSELVHDWEKELAKYNLGIQELESINYFTEETENGSFLNKVQFIFRKGHELITREFLVNSRGEKGEKGDPFTWDDLEDWQIQLLKGEKGDKGNDGEAPILSAVKITYSDSMQDIGGDFEKLGDSNVYTLHLTLPKQKTLQECIDIIQEAFDAFQHTVDERINQLSPFDFTKLGLRLTGTQLKLVYNGIESNPITINIPESHQYKLQIIQDQSDKWKDTINLLKDEEVLNSFKYAERFKPRDWWMTCNPHIILMSNGQLKTKNLYIKAWASQNGNVVDKTDEESGLTDKSFKIHIQSTSTQVDTIVDGQHQWVSRWYDIGFLYNNNTGLLSLPDNNAVVYDSGNQKVQFKYKPGDFISLVLWSTDSRPRRIYIPIVDVDNVYGNPSNNNGSSDIVTYENWDPNQLQDYITNCYLKYTRQYPCDLTNFYNRYDELIGTVVTIQIGTWEYKKVNGKKYFLGDYIIDNNVVEDETVHLDRFQAQEVVISNQGTFPALKFLYDGNTPTQKQMQVLQEAMYAEAGSQGWADMLFALYDVDGTQLDYSFDEIEIDGQNLLFQTGISLYHYFFTVQHSGPDVTYYLYLKHAKSGDRYGKFIITVDDDDNTQLRVRPIDTDPISVFNANFSSHFNGRTLKTYKYSNVTPPSGVVLVNDMYFCNGLFIAQNRLGGTPTIADSGQYAYITDTSDVKIQNLTNGPLTVDVAGRTFELVAHGDITEELQPSSPVGH